MRIDISVFPSLFNFFPINISSRMHSFFAFKGRMVLLELNHFSLHILWRKKYCDGACLQSRRFYRLFISISYSCYHLLVQRVSAACFLGSSTTGRKESLNVEMTSYASEAVNLKVILLPSLLENNPLFLSQSFNY